MRLGLGTWPLGGRAYGSVDPERARGVIASAYEMGVRVFDTANIYGDGAVEEMIGEVLAGALDLCLVTKGGYCREDEGRQDFSVSALLQSLDASADRLRVDVVDYFLLHSPPPEVLSSASALAERIVASGRARRVGVSLAHIDHYPLLAAWSSCAAVEFIYNILDQRAEDRAVFVDCKARNRTALTRLPLAAGLLAGEKAIGLQFPQGDSRSRWPQTQIDKWLRARMDLSWLAQEGRTLAQAAIGFCLSASDDVIVIPGAKSQAQLRENTNAPAMNLVERDRVRAMWEDLRHVVPN